MGNVPSESGYETMRRSHFSEEMGYWVSSLNVPASFRTMMFAWHSEC